MADIKSFALSRSERRDDNSLISPVELLEGLAAELRSAMADPETSLPDGAVVIFLHTGPDHSEFDVNWRASNLRNADLLGLIETAKAMVLAGMGYLAPQSD